MTTTPTAPETATAYPLGRPELLPHLKNYARLLVRTGTGLKQGQTLAIFAPIEGAAFAHLCAEEAYAAGAGNVTVIWNDPALMRLMYLNEPLGQIRRIPEWDALCRNLLSLRGCTWLFLEGEDPQAFADVDPAKPAAWHKAANLARSDYRHGIDFGLNAWCIGGVSTPAWAGAVFPGLPTDEAVDKLWDAVLFTARADGSDPEEDWREHDAAFEKSLSFMNDNAFSTLHFTSAQTGTDITVGLLEKNIWVGGGAYLQDGTLYFPNIPTEEIYASPNRLVASGIVYSSMPLVLEGTVVRDFWFRFENGAVTDFGAAEGYGALQHMLDTDEGARHIGECALVPKSSPVKQSDLLFYSTLFDENAACHFALGCAYAKTYEGGLTMTQDELVACGLNSKSAVHVDFMFGTDDMEITGTKADGTETAVFHNGTWAWEE